MFNFINHRVQKVYSTKLKELRQKRILAKLKKINKKRRKYHSVSTEGKATLSSNDNTVKVVSSETTTVSLTSRKSTENYEDEKHAQKELFFDTSVRPTETEIPKNYTSNVSDDVSLKVDASKVMLLAQNSTLDVTTFNNPGDKDSEAPSSESITKVAGMMKLCDSPVIMNDMVKERIHKLLQEEETRTVKAKSMEQNNKSLKLQSNFEAGLLNFQSLDGQCFPERRSLPSPVRDNTLSTSISSAVFASPPVSKAVSKTRGVLEKSDEEDNDDDDNVSKELKMLDAIVASKHEEELVAKKSRERMLKAYSVEKSNTCVLGGAKKSSIDYATAQMSPLVWHELIEERRKKWLENHTLWK